MKLGIHGCKGRMGTAIRDLAGRKNIPVTGAVDQGDSIESGLRDAEVILDFSFHEGTIPLLEWALKAEVPVVVGTTGHTESEREKIRNIAESLPIVWAGNYSVGVNVLLYLSGIAAEKLGHGYDPEIIEAHHKMKVDAPSGTARDLVDSVLKGLKWDRDAVIYGREGITGKRPERQLGVHAIRGGGIIGEHTILFSGASERLELTHRASDRSIFAEGAIRAGEWLLDSSPSPGIHTMQEVLGLSTQEFTGT